MSLENDCGDNQSKIFSSFYEIINLITLLFNLDNDIRNDEVRGMQERNFLKDFYENSLQFYLLTCLYNNDKL